MLDTDKNPQNVYEYLFTCNSVAPLHYTCTYKTTMHHLCLYTLPTGNKIYVIGGHDAQSPITTVSSVQYFHARRLEWRDAFALPAAGDYRDVDCCLLSVPLSNRDFTPVKYGDCKWVMW